MKILVAEDERVTRRSLQRQLEQWGHEAVAVDDGAQAWDRFQQEPFDIVVTDWDMPHVDGRELILRIRGSDSFRYAQATYNSNRVPDCELQRQVGRANFTTIQRYTHYAETHRELDYNVFLPESLKASEEWAYLESKPPWVVEKGKSRNTQSPARQGFVSSTP